MKSFNQPLCTERINQHRARTEHETAAKVSYNSSVRRLALVSCRDNIKGAARCYLCRHLSREQNERGAARADVVDDKESRDKRLEKVSSPNCFAINRVILTGEVRPVVRAIAEIGLHVCHGNDRNTQLRPSTLGRRQVVGDRLFLVSCRQSAEGEGHHFRASLR